MKVIFKNNWSTPLGRFRRSPEAQEVPESLRDQVPSRNIIVDESTVIEPDPDVRDIYRSDIEEKHNNELREADLERANSDAYMAAMEATGVEEKPAQKKVGRPKKVS